MGDEPNLYRTPAEILRAERDRLTERLAVEKREVLQFKSLRDKTSDELEELIFRAEDDVRDTTKLLAKYKAAIKAVGS